MPDEFKIYFNRRKQWIKVFLWDVHPSTFANWNQTRWGYFLATWQNPKSGEFGEVHFVKSKLPNHEDTVAHEMFHAVCEWMWANRTALTSNNEERMAMLLDRLVGSFYREYRKLK